MSILVLEMEPSGSTAAPPPSCKSWNLCPRVEPSKADHTESTPNPTPSDNGLSPKKLIAPDRDGSGYLCKPRR